MREKLSIILVTMFLCLTIIVPVGAAPTVNLDGQQLSFEVPPVIEDGRTLVPLRAIFEAMGATVSWDQGTQTATAVKGGTTVVLQIGSTTPTINGRVHINKLDVPAKVVSTDGKTYSVSTEKSRPVPTVTISTNQVPIKVTPPSTQAPQDVTVYVTKTGEKYHQAGCKSLSSSSIPMSLEDVKKQGYTPCSICNP